MEKYTVFALISSLPKAVLAIALDEESTAKQTVFLTVSPGRNKAAVEVHAMKAAEFSKLYQPTLWSREPFRPSVAAEQLLAIPKVKFSTAALDHLERILQLDTRGKSSAQIRDEIVKVAADLPKGHALKEVPATYPDRGAAIQAYTAIRQAILSTQQAAGGTDVAKKKAAEDKKVAAPEKSKKEIAAEKKAADAQAAKDKKEADAKAKADKKVADAAAKAGNGEAKVVADKAKAKGKKEPKVLDGAWKLNGKATTVKTPEELRLHEGSARYKLMEFMFANNAKFKNGVPVAKLQELLGDDTAYAIQSMSKAGYEFIAKA